MTLLLQLLAWRDASGTFRSNHCFHFPRLVENVPGLIDPIGGIHHVDSGVKITYVFNNTEAFVSIVDTLLGGEFPTLEQIQDAVYPTSFKTTTYNLGLVGYSV